MILDWQSTGALAFAAHRAGNSRGHHFPNAVSEEPSSLHGAIQKPLDLTGADALLAGSHQVDDLEPQAQGKVAAFKDGADPHGELLAAGVALQEAGTGRSAFQPLNAGRFGTVRADGTVRPQRRLDERKGGGFVLEMLRCKNGLGHRGNSYVQKPIYGRLVCQV